MDTLECRVWAEEFVGHGLSHFCHAQFVGLYGGTHETDKIKEDLAEATTMFGTWELTACEPLHDGKACESCEYRQYRGKSYQYPDI
jgi:hypothetical protein